MKRAQSLQKERSDTAMSHENYLSLNIFVVELTLFERLVIILEMAATLGRHLPPES
jgi:hypothetical protein